MRSSLGRLKAYQLYAECQRFWRISAHILGPVLVRMSRVLSGTLQEDDGQYRFFTVLGLGPPADAPAVAKDEPPIKISFPPPTPKAVDFFHPKSPKVPKL